MRRPIALIFGQAAGLGDAYGRYICGESNGWEVAGRSVLLAGSLVAQAVGALGIAKLAVSGVTAVSTRVAGRLAAKETRTLVVNEADDVIGGVYTLVDEKGIVRYVGQTKDFIRRLGEHFDDPVKNKLTFVRGMKSADKATRLVEEQRLINLYGGPKGGQLLNKINAIGPKNPLIKLVPNGL